jgi:hypothetical protein
VVPPELSRFTQFEWPLSPFSDFVDINPKLTIIGVMVHAVPSPEFDPFYTMQRRAVSTRLCPELATHRAFSGLFLSQDTPTAGWIPAFERPVFDPGTIGWRFYASRGRCCSASRSRRF